MTQISTVHMCLFLNVFLQQSCKHCVASNAGDCIYVLHLINTKKALKYLHITLIMAANYRDADFLQAV